MKTEKCSLCKGEGQISEGIIKESNGLTVESFSICPKCQGSPHLDWIEQIVGKQPKSNYISLGVYTKEVDLSSIVPNRSLAEMLVDGFELCDGKESTTDLKECFKFESADDLKEYFGEPDEDL